MNTGSMPGNVFWVMTFWPSCSTRAAISIEARGTSGAVGVFTFFHPSKLGSEKSGLDSEKTLRSDHSPSVVQPAAGSSTVVRPRAARRMDGLLPAGTEPHTRVAEGCRGEFRRGRTGEW